MFDTIKVTYRSLDKQIINLQGDFTVIIGPNNSGKSTILRGLQIIRDHFQKPVELLTDVENRWLNLDSNDIDDGFELDVGFPLRSLEVDSPRRFVIRFRHDDIQWFLAEQGISADGAPTSFKRNRFTGHGTTAWGTVASETTQNSLVKIFDENPPKNPGKLSRSDYRRQQIVKWFLGVYCLSHNRGSKWDDEIKATRSLDSQAVHLASRLDQLLSEQPRIFRVRLDDFMNSVIPNIGTLCTERFSAKADGTAPSVRIVFDYGGRRIPLRDLGGGVEQVLAIATVLLGEKDATLLLIEEPESHMHEGALRRLIEQIEQNRQGRKIVIATHSPVLLDMGFADRIYRITKANERSMVEECLSRKNLYSTLDHLGVMASSILQSNCVIWVEGATERNLIRYWISLVDGEIKEHEHYTFAMTNGSCISYLTTDPEDGELIQIMKLCRNYFVIADRDKGPDVPPSKEAIQRFVKELEKSGKENQLWITDNYEIEWYFPKEVVLALWPGVKIDDLFSDANLARPFYDALAEAAGPAKVKSAYKSKPDWAQKAVSQNGISNKQWFGGNLNNALCAHVKRLVEFINKANNRQSSSGVQKCHNCGEPLQSSK